MGTQKNSIYVRKSPVRNCGPGIFHGPRPRRNGPTPGGRAVLLYVSAEGARDAADGLRNPTSVALRGNDVYVLSAACTTATAPNLLRAHLRDRR
ncbi:hypothetical protein EES45_31250 [Streptomyces sp. ADI97-07]|nr:hypothetical protein EES45_31250 [Streptomyces sp. ADI97-07]